MWFLSIVSTKSFDFKYSLDAETSLEEEEIKWFQD